MNMNNPFHCERFLLWCDVTIFIATNKVINKSSIDIIIFIERIFFPSSGSDLTSSLSGLKGKLRDYDTGESGDELETDCEM